MEELKVSPKEERFAQAIINTAGDKVEAYKNAGYSLKLTKPQMCTQADKIYNRPNVTLRIKQLQKIELTVIVATKEDKLLILEKVIKACSMVDGDKGMMNAPSVIAAIKEHNVMQGDNAPTETINTHNINKADDDQW
tara:strand:+ start:366 stop:776 length:411 start_codon:yes stop_codon:yes gene_type:complete